MTDRHRRDRLSLLRTRLRWIGSRFFDPDVHLIRAEVGAGGHFIAEESLEYATLLFDGADAATRDTIARLPPVSWWAADEYLKDPGGAQRREANAVVRVVLEGQDRRIGSPTAGHFRWRRQDDTVQDLNATAFLTHGLGHVASAYASSLEDSTIEMLHTALELAAEAMVRRAVPAEYTNIQMLTIGGLVQAGAVLNRDDLEHEAMRRFDAWLELTDRDGLHEWNCQTYTPLALAGLEAAWSAARKTEHRERLHRTLDLLSYLTAAHVLPGGSIGGTGARAYERDLTGRSILSVYAHAKFGTYLAPGTLERARLLATICGYYDYEPPTDVANRARHSGGDARQVDERTGTIRRRHYYRGRLSLASQDMTPPCGSPPGPVVFIVRDAAGEAPTIALLPSSHPRLATVAAVCAQEAGAVLVHLTWPMLGGAADPVAASPQLVVGEPDGLHEVRIDGQLWDGRYVTGQGSLRLELAFDERHLQVLLDDLDGSGQLGWTLERSSQLVSFRILPPSADGDGSRGCGVLIDADGEPGRSTWSITADAGLVAVDAGTQRRLQTEKNSDVLPDLPLFSDGSLVLVPGQIRAVADGAPRPFDRDV